MGVPAAAATRSARSATSRFRRNQASPSSPTASVPMPPTTSDTTGFAAAADRKALVNDACGKRAVTEAVSE